MEIKAATARLTGYRHQQDGTTCQDWVRYKMQDGIGVLSLCEGAGSCAHAEEAAFRIYEMEENAQRSAPLERMTF